MLHARIRTGALAVSGVAIALLLTGCDLGGSADPGNPEVPTVTESTSRQAAPVPPGTASSPPVSTAQAQQPQPTPKPAPGSEAECKVADLKLSLQDTDAEAGTAHRNLIFTNKGSRTCTIQGFPGVSYVTGDDGRQVGPAAFRTGEKGPVITLKPGASAFSDIGFVQVRNYDPAVCKPTEVRGLRVYPPHEYDSMFIESPGTGCAGTPPGHQLTVRTVQAA